MVTGVDSLELAEDVCVLGQDGAGLQHGDPEGEHAAHLQLPGQLLPLQPLAAALLQLQVWRHTTSQDTLSGLDV